jgi:hypothetical protein
MMSKSKLREEYEARFGVVKGGFRLYNAKGIQIYYEDPLGWWAKYGYDAKGNETYYEHSHGYWAKYGYDAKGNEIYREDFFDGVTLDNRPCSGKVFIEQQTGRKFKMVESKMVEVK